MLATFSQLISAKTEETISHVKGWVNCQIVIKLAKCVLLGALRGVGNKSLADPGSRIGVGLGIGIGAIIFLCQDSFRHT